MATKQITRNIVLSPQLDKLVRSKIASGRYQSASEVIRDGLRLLERRDEDRTQMMKRLQDEIEEGWQAGQRGEVVSAESVFEEIRQMSKSRHAKLRKAQ